MLPPRCRPACCPQAGNEGCAIQGEIHSQWIALPVSLGHLALQRAVQRCPGFVAL